MSAEIDTDTTIITGKEYGVPSMRYRISLILTQTPNVVNRDTYEGLLNLLQDLPDSSMVQLDIDQATGEIKLMGS